MSEYQYYEFRTIDRPLTPEQMKEVRALSSRAEITPRSFTNTYNYGDFRGNPRRLMERYYDAHVYVSNFGSVHFMLRLPREVVSEDTLDRYETDEALEWWSTDAHTILVWQVNDDPFDEWVEGPGWMDRLLSLRDELVRGDYRSLYLGWLSSIAAGSSDDYNEEDEYEEEYGEEDDDEADEEDGDEVDEDDDEADEEEGFYGAASHEPPVPIGLQSLTDAQSALAEFLFIDSDLIAAAAAASPEASAEANSSKKMTEWVAQLPEQEARALLVQILQGEALQVQTDLQSRFFRSGSRKSDGKRGRTGRTVAELLTLAEQTKAERKQREAKETERKRTAHLKGLEPRLPNLWTTVSGLAEEQKAASYDQVRTLLVDMRDAYDFAGRRPEFDQEFKRFLDKYSRSKALVGRLKDAGLM